MSEELWTRALRVAFSKPIALPAGPRYTLKEEIARGGMGVVYLAHDASLQRDIAVKKLREQYAAEPHLVARFLREAQVAAQLEHPGVVPVHELGTDEQGRPFIAMKRVEGKTLEALLFERKHRLSAFLRIFEQICQTIAYAHSRGVIHRDLKPSNIMVGAFGEVQIVDWGLAKAGDDEPASIGSPMGTPAYMAPEQAKGELSEIDARTDVFCLGAILCEILTGRPPVEGADMKEIVEKAAKGEYALSGLDACDADLARLVKDCLRAKNERPPNAGALADRVTVWLADAADRVRKAELAAAEARGAKRLTLGLTAAAMLLLVGTGAFLWNRSERQRRTEREVETVLAEAERKDWKEAEETASRALALIRAGRVREELERKVRERLDFYRRMRREQALLEKIEEVREFDALPGEIDGRYRAAFVEMGLDIDQPEETGRRIRAMPWSARLVAALDHWASRIPPHEADLQERWKRVVLAAACADSDEWQIRLRRALLEGDRGKILELANSVHGESHPPQSFLLLGQAVSRVQGGWSVEREVLLEGYRQHPGDFWINRTFTHRLLDAKRGPPDLHLVERHARITFSLKPEDPENCFVLGATLRILGRRPDQPEALDILKKGRTHARPGLVADALDAAILDAEGRDATHAIREFRARYRQIPPQFHFLLSELVK